MRALLKYLAEEVSNRPLRAPALEPSDFLTTSMSVVGSAFFSLL